MPKNPSRFALFGLAFVLTLPVFACDSGDAGKKPTIDTESQPKVPTAAGPTTNAVAPTGPAAK